MQKCWPFLLRSSVNGETFCNVLGPSAAFPFLCQAAAEKLLKGLLIAQGWSLERTHDVVALLELCAAYDHYLLTQASR